MLEFGYIPGVKSHETKQVMEVRNNWPAQRGLHLNRLPWWAYALFIPAVYLLGWVLHLIGVIPGR